MAVAAILALGLLVPLLPLLPSGEAQGAASAAAAPAAVEVLADPAGDVMLASSGQEAANPTPRLAQLDLRGATVQERATGFAFSLTVAGLEATAEPPLAESAFYLLHFRQGDVQYAIQAGRIKSQDAGIFALLSRYDPAEARYYAIDYVPIEADVAAATLTVTAGRELLVDSRGAKPYPGTALDGFWAESQSFMEIFLFPASFTGGAPPTLRDRMPDAGNGTAAVPVVLGPVQTGSARLSAQIPTRQSNGEAGTFVFAVEARNVGAEADRYRLAPLATPPGWTITIPEQVVALDAGETASIPIVTSVPFTHQHGAFSSFLLRLESTTDPASHADLELGIRYPKVPQPAGHHPILWLHATPFTDDPTVPAYALAFGFNIEYAWMNALQEDPGDRKVAVPADPTFSMTPTVPDTFRWAVPLAPDLAIGLDFDTAATGAFDGTFSATTPVLGASLSAELVHYADSRFDQFGIRTGGERTVLATAAQTAPQDLQAGAKLPYHLDIQPTAEADLVPFQPKTSLVLELALTGMRPNTPLARDPPKLEPGATLLLPLLEYHDPVDAVFASTAELAVHATSEQDRKVNPGKTIIYTATATLAETATATDVRITVAGPSAPWARILGPTQHRLEPGASATVHVAVAVPASAPTTQAIDLVVTAEAVDDPGLRALVRFYGTIVTDPVLPDEAAKAAEIEGATEAKAPAPAAALIAVLLVACAASVAGRRRIR